MLRLGLLILVALLTTSDAQSTSQMPEVAEVSTAKQEVTVKESPATAKVSSPASVAASSAPATKATTEAEEEMQNDAPSDPSTEPPAAPLTTHAAEMEMKTSTEASNPMTTGPTRPTMKTSSTFPPLVHGANATTTEGSTMSHEGNKTESKNSSSTVLNASIAALIFSLLPVFLKYQSY